MSVMITCTLCSGGSRGGRQGAHSPLTFRPNCSPKGQNNFLGGPLPFKTICTVCISIIKTRVSTFLNKF